ncbi:ABC transporter ATP-binding protein [Terracoccus luteus]|jgi:spermidine/putrescine transport system ATP-binding protein|uniref:Spermidine/putrescine import ATP-binding protein PotA n=1 Tax=Terracoccus luteus TaxID=53356 RepID=A0A839PXS1_9MICO|nr:ABC transporter ATP-binding protein [Terracoccus luteus]MBB2985201.1 spermidine/putrescine transport system ATP-binding protein [Terracoccus luteus]MCP2170853.1 spermidine/putrescine transport system ATP-binding protein [Terracoccus luteus]
MADSGFRSATGDLHLDAVTKSFASFTAVDDLTLDVPRGSFFALLGPSGCGKTTTLRMVAGLEQPTSGRILIGETDLTGSRPYERPVNTVFQSYALFPHLTIRDNVAFGPKRRKQKDAGSLADAALDLVQMSHLAGRKPTQLSGGQQQRVALARALVNRPEVLLLDEPLGALDLKLRREMQVELKRIQTEVGLTFIHVTHDQEEAMTMADTVAVMNAGHIEQMGAPEELYDLPRTAFVANFLGQSNLGEARVTGRDGDHLVAEVAGTSVRVLQSRSSATGDDLVFGVRPEKVRIHEDRPEGVGNDVRGTVTDVSFTGVATQYLVRVASGATWAVYEQNLDVERGTIHRGDEVWLAWDPGHAFAVPATDRVPATVGSADSPDDVDDEARAVAAAS